MAATNSEDNVKERQIDAEIKKGIDARTKEFKEKIGRLAYERIKKQLAPPTEPLKGYPYNESVEEADSTSPNMAKAVQGLNDLGYKLRGRRRFHSGVKRVETFFRSGNKKLLQGAIDVLDPDTRDDVMGILEPLGFVKNGVVESVDLEEKLKVSDGLGAWITDFKDSDAPQFKDADEKKRRDMAIAAFVAAGGKLGEDIKEVKVPANYAAMMAKKKAAAAKAAANKEKAK